MRIQFASDLHLELQENSRWIKHNPLELTGDVLVLAGDIMYLGSDTLLRHPFWDWASDNYRQVLVVPGNHEFYGGWDIGQLHVGWSMETRGNVHYYYNSVVRMDDVELVLTTLWAHIPVRDAFACEHGVTDFRRIVADGERMDFVRFNEEYSRCREFLERVCSVPTGGGQTRVVVSHHLPSFLLMDPRFKGSALNGAFVSEMYDVIADRAIDWWVYGHSHRNVEATVAGCRCVSNQLGYVACGENVGFDGGRVLDTSLTGVGLV